MVDSMTELENRLRETLLSLNPEGSYKYVSAEEAEELIPRIRQAFIDAGYMRPANLTEEQAMDELEKRL